MNNAQKTAVSRLYGHPQEPMKNERSETAEIGRRNSSVTDDFCRAKMFRAESAQSEILNQDVFGINERYPKKFDYPYEFTKIDEKLNEELLKYFTGERTGFVQVGPKKWFFPSGFAKQAANYYNFKLRKDDVFVVTFPRSGTTWTQEMVWLIANDLDYETASKKSLNERFPFLEFSCFVHKDTKAEFLTENILDLKKYKAVLDIDVPAWEIFTKSTNRRFIKTHLPFSLLPPNLLEVGCKVIYVARNPKDVAVSFYHLNKSIRTQGYIGDFPRYWYYFQRNLQPWTPYWEHIKEGWDRRNCESVLFLFYENMSKNTTASIEKVCNFLGKSYTKDQIETLKTHLKFENFKKNPSVNSEDLRDLGIIKKTEQGFVRKGENDGWRNYFDEELNVTADEWIEKNLQYTDLRFPL